jgi:methyl-accepting chemotaxis protein
VVERVDVVSFFENLKISAKIMLLLCLLGLFALATTVFSAGKMHSIEDTYSALLTKDAKGELEMQRITARLLDTGRLMYRLMAESDLTRMQAIDRELAATTEKLRGYAQNAKKYLPKKAGEIDRLLVAYDSLIKDSQDIRAKALAGDTEPAKQLMRERFEPAMTVLRNDLNTFTAAISNSLDKASDAAAVETDATIRLNYIAIGVGLALVLALAAVVSRRYLSQPIVAMGSVMHRLAEHDYAVEIHGAEREDEVGMMAKTVQVFKDALVRADEAAAQQERERQERENRAHRIEVMTRDFDGSVSTILGTVAEAGVDMQSTASSMSAAAEQTTRQARVVAAAAEDASTNVQTVAEASEELASSIKEIARQVNQSALVAANAAEKSAKTNDLMLGLAQSAQRIGEVVSLINKIASQTNLLALNATIEAARAGDAGKGFAVVANEVKALSNQTSRATDEITQHVVAVQAATEEAVRAIQSIGLTISEINEISAAIASAVEEQGSATQDIARNVQQAAEGTQQVTRNIGGVSQAATQTGRSAHSVLNAATELARESDLLRRVVNGFLKDVCAA